MPLTVHLVQRENTSLMDKIGHANLAVEENTQILWAVKNANLVQAVGIPTAKGVLSAQSAYQEKIANLGALLAEVRYLMMETLFSQTTTLKSGLKE